LSAEQHRLIEELTRAAFEAADLKQPSAAVRDDLTGTLQAAIADPDVTARLGRLAKPERWSGFGAFGDAAPAATAKQSRPATPPPRDTAVQRRQKKLNAAKKSLAAAERAKAEADDALSRRQAELDAARHRRDQALADVRAAEREFNKAEANYDTARRAGRAAADSVKEAKAQLKRA
jgi:hypothetical protein